MQRDKNLIPLSHHHQHALALCVRIERSEIEDATDLLRWQEEVARAFAYEINYHFNAEEKVLFPAALAYPGLQPIVGELLEEHHTLRHLFSSAQARQMDAAGLKGFARRLSDHVRKEERQLFEGCQKLMPAAELDRLGAAMDKWFAESGMPGASCEIRPRKP